MSLIKRLQSQLHYSAEQNLEKVVVSPFACYFHPTETAVFANYAIPIEPVQEPTSLEPLKAVFRQRGRTPRLEYLDSFAPNLAAILQAADFVEELRSYLLVCDAEALRAVPLPPSLTIQRLAQDTPIANRQAFVTIQSRAFGHESAPMATVAEANRFWQQFAGVEKFMAWWAGEPVAVGSLTQAYLGVAEVAGIATLAGYRRQGIGTAVTGHISRYALQQRQGIDTVFLTAGDERAGRVYERVGYQPVGSGLAYICTF